MGAGFATCCNSTSESAELKVSSSALGGDGVSSSMVVVDAKEFGARYNARSTARRMQRSPTKVQEKSAVNDLPICPLHGVTLAFMEEFGDTHKSKVSPENFSIGGLCFHIIKPLTMFKGGKLCMSAEDADELLSYAEVGFQQDLKDKKKQPCFITMAHHFVSHAWRYNYSTFLDALETWDARKGGGVTTYFWVDAFVVNQHIADSYPMEWWSTRFAQAVGDVGSTILVSMPWEDPTPLKRVWVIWEIFCAYQTGARFDIAMPRKELDGFRAALITSFPKVQTALSKVDVELSSAFHKSHQDMVHDEIRRTIGFTKLNEMVQLRMTRWLIGMATSELQSMKENATSANWKDRMGLQDNLARMLRESGNFTGAEFYFKELLAEVEAKQGKDHVMAMSALNQLAVTLQKGNQIEEAMDRHRDCLQRRRRILGENHEETLQSVSNLAVLLSLRRPLTVEIFDEARSLYSLAVKGREATIGAKDPRTLYTQSNFARFLSEAPVPSAELFAESEQLHERAVENLTAALQQGHPLTLASLHNQACSWIDRCFHEEGSLTGKRVDTAVEQLRLVHKLRIEKLGKEHPDTQQTEKKISEISNLQKQMEKDGANHGAMEAFGTWQDLFNAHFEEVSTAEQFRKVRTYMFDTGADLVFEDLLQAGFLSEDGILTAGMQPYNFMARIVTGDLVQRKCQTEQAFLGEYGSRFVIAHNKPESEDMWSSSDPSWIGKASMSKNHRFMAFKDLRWEFCNILAVGIDSGSAHGLAKLQDMKKAAVHWVQHAPGWSPPEKTAFLLAVWPLTGVPCLHLHIVDLSCSGPSFERLSRKLLPLDDAIRVLEDEVKGCDVPVLK